MRRKRLLVKRIMASVLSAAMVISSVPMTAFAEEVAAADIQLDAQTDEESFEEAGEDVSLIEYGDADILSDEETPLELEEDQDIILEADADPEETEEQEIILDGETETASNESEGTIDLTNIDNDADLLALFDGQEDESKSESTEHHCLWNYTYEMNNAYTVCEKGESFTLEVSAKDQDGNTVEFPSDLTCRWYILGNTEDGFDMIPIEGTDSNSYTAVMGEVETDAVYYFAVEDSSECLDYRIFRVADHVCSQSNDEAWTKDIVFMKDSEAETGWDAVLKYFVHTEIDCGGTVYLDIPSDWQMQWSQRANGEEDWGVIEGANGSCLSDADPDAWYRLQITDSKGHTIYTEEASVNNEWGGGDDSSDDQGQNRDIWVEGYGKSVTDEEGNVEFQWRQDGDSTWIYPDEQGLQIVYNIDNIADLSQDDYRMNWTVLNGDSVISDNPVDDGLISVENTGDRITVTLDGTKFAEYVTLPEDQYEQWLTLRLAIENPQDEDCILLTEEDCAVRLRNPQTNMHFSEGYELLPGESAFIFRLLYNVDVENADYPIGASMDATVTDVRILENDGNAISLEEEEEGWHVYAVNCGYAQLEYTVVVDGLKSPETVKQDFYINANKWDLEVIYPNDNNQMIPDSEMDISTAFHHGFFATDDDNNVVNQWEDPEYSLEILEDSYDTELIDVEIHDGKTIHVTSKGKTGETYIGVMVNIQNEDGSWMQATWSEIRINVIEEFYYMRPYDSELGTIMPGESMNVQAQLWHSYVDEEGNSHNERCTGVRYRWEWDRDWDNNLDPVTITYQNEAGETVRLAMPEGETDAEANTSFAEEYTITRIENWDMHYCLIAEIQREDEYNTWYEEVCRGNYHMNEYQEPDRDIWVERYGKNVTDADGNVEFQWRQDGASTWIYPDEQGLQIVYNIDNLSDLSQDEYSLNWMLFRYTDDNGHYEVISENPETAGLISVENANNRITATLDGTKFAEYVTLPEDQYEEWVNFRLAIERQQGEESNLITDEECAIRLRNPQIELYSIDTNPVALMPGWDYDIWRGQRVGVENAEYPFGGELDAKITNVKILDNDENVISITEEEDYWHVVAQGYGSVLLEYTFSIDGLDTTITAEQEFYVNSDIWNLDRRYPNDSDQMTPGAEMIIVTTLNHGYRVENENHDFYDEWENPEYILEIIEDSYDSDLIDAEILNDTEIHVTSKDRTGGTNIGVIVKVQDENGDWTECTRDNFWVNVNEDFYYLQMSGIETETIKPGESMNISAQLWRAHVDEDGNMVHEQVGDARFRWEWDRDWNEDVDPIAITYLNADGETVALAMPKAEDGSDEDANISFEENYTITRIENWGLNYRLIAEVLRSDEDNTWYEEVSRRDYYMDEYHNPYYDSYFEDAGRYDQNTGEISESRRNEWGDTWLYTNESDLYAVINIAQLKDAGEEEYRLHWQMGDYIDENGTFEVRLEDDAVLDLITVEEKDSSLLIRLDGTKIKDERALVDENGEGWFRLRLMIEKQDTESGFEIACTDIGIEVRNPRIDYLLDIDEPGANELLVNWRKELNSNTIHCWVEDAAHPYEYEYLNGQIKNIEIVDGTNINEEGNAIIQVEKLDNDSSRWMITALDYGWADIMITVSDESGRYEETLVRSIGVNGDIYYLNGHYPDDNNNMLLNSEMQIGTSISHCFKEYHADESFDNWDEPDYALEISVDEEGNECYDRELISARIGEDGKTVIVASNNNTGNTDIWVDVIMFEEDGSEAFRFGRKLNVNVYYYYTSIRPTTIDMSEIAVGEAVEFTPEVWSHSNDDDEEIHSLFQNVRYVWDWDQIDGEDTVEISYLDEDGNKVVLNQSDRMSAAKSYTLTRKTSSDFRIYLRAERPLIIEGEICLDEDQNPVYTEEISWEYYINETAKRQKLEFEGHTYQLIYDYVNWFEAKERAEELGGHLVTINSEAEKNAVKDYLAECADPDREDCAWIGLVKIDSNGWRWLTDETLDQNEQFWGDNEGNDWGEHFVAKMANIELDGRIDAGEWIDDTPWQGNCYIVEFDNEQVAVFTEEVESVLALGQCGENAYWIATKNQDGRDEYDEEKQEIFHVDEAVTLTITGTGEMWNYDHWINDGEDQWSWDEEAPWTEWGDETTQIIVEEGITSIGNFAFAWEGKVKEISLPSTLISIGEFAFHYLRRGLGTGYDGLTSITIPSSVKSIGRGAFFENILMVTVNYDGDLASICPAAYEDGNEIGASYDRVREAFDQTPFYDQNYGPLYYSEPGEIKALDQNRIGRYEFSMNTSGLYELNLNVPAGTSLEYCVTRFTRDENGEPVFNDDCDILWGSSLNEEGETVSCKNVIELNTEEEYILNIFCHETVAVEVSFGINKLIHKAEVAQSCTVDGNQEYEYCEATNTAYIPDANGNLVEILLEEIKYPATGHTEVTDVKVEATCTEDGMTEGKHCSVCNEILAEQTTVPAKGHNFTDGMCTICGIKNGFVKDEKGQWIFYKNNQIQCISGLVRGTISGVTDVYYVKEGVYQPSAEGVAPYADESSTILYYVQNGKKTTASGIAKKVDLSDTYWYYVKDGVHDAAASGITQKADGSSATWFYVQNGMFAKKNGITQKADGSSATWFYVQNGMFAKKNGITQKADGSSATWFYVQNGMFAKKSGIAQKADGSSATWFYVQNGIFTKNSGITQKADGSSATWFYVQNGIFTKNSGIAKNADGSGATWFYVLNGIYKKTTCIAVRADGSSKTKFYVLNGTYTKTTGTVTVGGKTYKLKNGVVQ